MTPMNSSPPQRPYRSKGRALAFMVTCGMDDDELRTIHYYASHEALLLEYEHALTRIDSRTGLPYDT